MSDEQYQELDFDCDYCGTETMEAYHGPYDMTVIPRGWRKDYNKMSCMSGQCYEDHLHYFENKETGGEYNNDNWLDSIINDLKDKYETLNFYPLYYDSKWHVSIRDGAIEYRLYPYYDREDCIEECRLMNKRHNV